MRTTTAEVPAVVIDPLELDAAVLHHLDGDERRLTTASSMSVPELPAAVRRIVERVEQALADAHSSVFAANRYVKKLKGTDQ